MRPSLLSKREIDVAKSKDRAREIQEGLKLTRKVDSLRELQSETEANYEKFRSETLQEIQRQIDVKIAESESLDNGIAKKKSELLSLSGSIDSSWLYYVTSEKALIEGIKSELEHNNIEVIRKSTDLSVAKEVVSLEKASYLEGQTKNAEQYMLARRLKDETKKIRDEAKLKSSELLEKANRKEKAASKREIDTEIKQQNVLLYEESLKKKEKEIEQREMKILVKELELYSPVKRI